MIKAAFMSWNVTIRSFIQKYWQMWWQLKPSVMKLMESVGGGVGGCNVCNGAFAWLSNAQACPSDSRKTDPKDGTAKSSLRLVPALPLPFFLTLSLPFPSPSPLMICSACRCLADWYPLTAPLMQKDFTPPPPSHTHTHTHGVMNSYTSQCYKFPVHVWKTCTAHANLRKRSRWNR